MSWKRQRWHREDYAKRRAAGICSSCNRKTAINPRTGKPLARCERHGAMAAEASKRYVTAARRRWLESGLCCECGAPCGFNRRDGKVYRRCLTHRLAGAASVRAYAYRVKAEKAVTAASKDEARVLGVIESVAAKTQAAIRREAGMDTSRCVQALQRLVAHGLVARYTAQAIGRGRPAYLYRRVQNVPKKSWYRPEFLYRQKREAA